MRNGQITAVMAIETMQNEIDLFVKMIFSALLVVNKKSEVFHSIKCFRLHRLPDARSIMESVSLISPPHKKRSRIESSSDDE